MRHFLPIIYCFVLASCSAAEPGPVGAVPADMLDGKKLIMKDFNLSIAAPGDDWTWKSAKNGDVTGYACRKGKLAFVVMPQALAKFDDSSMKNILSGATAAAKKAGFTVSDDKIEAAEKLSGFDAYQIHYLLASSDQKTKMNCHMYVIKIDGKTALVVQYNGASEPPEFKTFVSSIETRK